MKNQRLLVGLLHCCHYFVHCLDYRDDAIFACIVYVLYLLHNCLKCLQWCYTTLNVTEEVAWEKVSLIICLEYIAVNSPGLSDWDPNGVV